MGQHSASTDRDQTGPIPWGDLLKSAMADAGTIHPDHLPSDHFETDQAKQWGVGVLDRALRTGLQAAVAWFGSAQAAGLDIGPKTVLVLAGVVSASMVLSVLTALVSAPSFDNSWWFQVLERAVKTFAQNVIAGWGVTETANVVFTGGFPTTITSILSSAGVATVVSVVMSVITTNMGNTDGVDISV